MSTIQSKIAKHAKKQKMWTIIGRKVNLKKSEMIEIMKLVHELFKTAITNIFKFVKENKLVTEVEDIKITKWNIEYSKI